MSVALYLLNGFGLMKIAEKLGMQNGYYAFIPFLRYWYLGKIAENCDERADQKPAKWSALYLAATIVTSAASVVFIVMYFAFYFSLFASVLAALGGGADDVGSILGSSFAKLGIGALVGFVVAAAVVCAASVAVTVIQALINYRVFRTFAPRHVVWMLILSIFYPAASAVLYMIFGFVEKFTPAKGPYVI